jgi:hypothetical protein
MSLELMEASLAFERCTVAELRLEIHHLRVAKENAEEALRKREAAEAVAIDEHNRLLEEIGDALNHPEVSFREAILDLQNEVVRYQNRCKLLEDRLNSIRNLVR